MAGALGCTPWMAELAIRTLYRWHCHLSPKSPSQMLFELAREARWLGDLELAERHYRSALEIAPDDHAARWNLAQVLLTKGEYERAWPLFGSRFNADPTIYRPNITAPEWNGEPIYGKKLLIVFEQGLGDQIQFSRFIPMLKNMGAEITFSCANSLGKLFSQFGTDMLYGSEIVRLPKFDFWVMICDLGARLGITLENLPNEPYLFATPKAASGRIGISWKGSATHKNDANRSLDLAARDLLLSIPGSISLHPEDTGAGDFLDTAKIVSALDLVISVDTSIAHLSAALGIKTIILLPARNTDWRWMIGRTDSPWYKSAYLARQSISDSWSDVIERVRHNILGI